MKKQEVRALIEEIGIVPVIRAGSPEEAGFAAEAVWRGGIPIVEITMTVPGALEVISELVKTMPKVLVGAGTVVNQDLAFKSFDAGAQFFVTPGFSQQTVAAAHDLDLLIMAAGPYPSQEMNAWGAGGHLPQNLPSVHTRAASYVTPRQRPLARGSPCA